MLLLRGSLCVCNRAFCAFVPEFFVRRQQAGFLGVIGMSSGLWMRALGFIARGLSSAVADIKVGVIAAY